MCRILENSRQNEFAQRQSIQHSRRPRFGCKYMLARLKLAMCTAVNEYRQTSTTLSNIGIDHTSCYTKCDLRSNQRQVRTRITTYSKYLLAAVRPRRTGSVLCSSKFAVQCRLRIERLKTALMKTESTGTNPRNESTALLLKIFDAALIGGCCALVQAWLVPRSHRQMTGLRGSCPSSS